MTPLCPHCEELKITLRLWETETRRHLTLLAARGEEGSIEWKYWMDLREKTLAALQAPRTDRKTKGTPA